MAIDRIESVFATLQYEIAEERASALGRMERRLELLTWLRGDLVGTDAYGNRYYRLKNDRLAAAWPRCPYE